MSAVMASRVSGMSTSRMETSLQCMDGVKGTPYIIVCPDCATNRRLGAGWGASFYSSDQSGVTGRGTTAAMGRTADPFMGVQLPPPTPFPSFSSGSDCISRHLRSAKTRSKRVGTGLMGEQLTGRSRESPPLLPRRPRRRRRSRCCRSCGRGTPRRSRRRTR